MKLQNCFLVFGISVEPATVLIDDMAYARLLDSERIAAKHGKESLRHDAYRRAFGLDVQFAFPCWIDAAMTYLATQYKGEHERKVRGLAACVVTGTPYGGSEGSSKPEGGQPSLIDPVKPKPRKPNGGVKLAVKAAA